MKSRKYEPYRKDDTAELVRYRFRRNERTYDFKIIYDDKHQEATIVEASISQKEVSSFELTSRLGMPLVNEYVYKALIEKKLVDPGKRFNIKVIV